MPLYHHIPLFTNYLPRVSDNEDVIWRRLIVIPFNAKITGKSDIKNYADYLYEKAGGYVMKLIIEGAKKAIDEDFKFKEPKAVLDAVAAYKEDNDWLGQFVEDHCEVAPSYEVKSGELYQCYRASCLETGEYIRSTTDFYNALEKAGYKKCRRYNGRMILGLKLKDGQDFLD